MSEPCWIRRIGIAPIVLVAALGAAPSAAQTCFSYVNTTTPTPILCVQQGDLTTPCSWGESTSCPANPAIQGLFREQCHQDGDPSDCCTTIPASSPQTVLQMHSQWHQCLGAVGDICDGSNPPQRGQRWYAFHRQIEADYNIWRESDNFCNPTEALPQGCKIESVDWCPNMALTYGFVCAQAAPNGSGCGTAVGGTQRLDGVLCPSCSAFPHCLFLGGGGPLNCPNAPSNSCSAGPNSFPYASLEEFKTVEEVTTALDAAFHGSMHSAVGAAGPCKDINNSGCSVRDPMFWRLHKAIDDVVRAWQNVHTTDVMLVLDRSGSMNDTDSAGGTKLARAVEAARLFGSLVDGTPPPGQTNRIGIVSYASTATDAARNLSIIPVTSTLSEPGEPFDDTLTAITGAGGGGCTGIGGAVQAALDQLCPSGDCSLLPEDPPAGENRRKAILLLTDGIENVPPCLQPAGASGGTCGGSCFGGQVDFQHLFDAQVCAVGFGDAGSLNGDLLTVFAERQGGIYMQNPATDPDGKWIDLKDFFAKCFGQLSDEFLGLDPKGTLAADEGATEIVEYTSCGDQRLTFVSGWKEPVSKNELRLLVNSPAGDLVRSGGLVETTTEPTWDYARVGLPYRGAAQGTWQAQLVRPHRQFVNGFTSDAFVDFEAGVALVRREIQRLCPDGCRQVLFFEHQALGPSVYRKALELEAAAGLLGNVEAVEDPPELARRLERPWDLIVYARQGGDDRPERYDDRLARLVCAGQRAILTDTRLRAGAGLLRCAGASVDGSRDHPLLVGGAALVPAPLELHNPGHPFAAYGLVALATQPQGFFSSGPKKRGPIGVLARVDKGVEHDWFVDILVRGLTRLEPHKPVSHVRTGDDLLPSVRVLPSFVPAGGWDRVNARVDIERPLVGFNTWLTRHHRKVEPRERKADTEDPRARVLLALEESRPGPLFPTQTESFPLFDDGTNGDLVSKNAYWSAQLGDLTGVDGMYRYRFVLDFEKNGCTTRRELVQSVFVEVGVDPQASDVSVAPAQTAPGGRSSYQVRILPRDTRGNLWGFGRAGAVACGPDASCSCQREEVKDHGDGSYTVNVVAPSTSARCRLDAFGADFELEIGPGARACSDLLKSVETAKIDSPQLRHRLELAARQSCGALVLQRRAAAASLAEVLHEIESHSGTELSAAEARALAAKLRAVAAGAAAGEEVRPHH